jgi:hypothetical protein
MNRITLNILRVAATAALGATAGLFCFKAHAAGAAHPALAFVDGRLAHATRIEAGKGAQSFLPRDTSGAFDSVSVQMDADVVLKSGPAYVVRVRTETNLQKYVQVMRVGAALNIATTGSYSTRTPVKIEIAAPSLMKLDASGTGHLLLEGKFVSPLIVDAEGAWQLEGQGAVPSLTLRLHDSSTAALGEFSARDVDVKGGTTGAVTLFARDRVTASLPNTAGVLVQGHPGKLEVHDMPESRLRIAP